MSNPKHLTVHHIIPTSRGGADSEQNTCLVRKGPHQNYHRLLENKTPDEIIEYLVNTFWDRNWEVIEKYSSGGNADSEENTYIVDRSDHRDYYRLFGNKTQIEILEYLVNTFWNGNSEIIEIFVSVMKCASK